MLPSYDNEEKSNLTRYVTAKNGLNQTEYNVFRKLSFLDDCRKKFTQELIEIMNQGRRTFGLETFVVNFSRNIGTLSGLAKD